MSADKWIFVCIQVTFTALLFGLWWWSPIAWIVAISMAVAANSLRIVMIEEKVDTWKD